MNSAPLIQASRVGQSSTKVGRVADIFPTEAMNFGELKPRCRRPDQERPYDLNFPFGPLGKAHRARTGLPLIGGLEIDRNERIHGIRRYHTAFR